MEQRMRLETTSFSLHMMAMGLMLCDHIWGVLGVGGDWLTCVGRIAFPIFAFLLVEGCFHTRNRKQYALRMLLFAVLTEIPFNLAVGSRVFYPIHQNVLWCFLIGIGLIAWNERAKADGRLWKRVLVAAGSVACSIVGLLGMVDYYHAGILTVLVFYFAHGNRWYHRVLQLLGLWYINAELLGGLVYEFVLFGNTVVFHQQSFALLALLPIWLYRGRQGPHNKAIKYFNYAFYPVHLLLLGLIKML